MILKLGIKYLALKLFKVYINDDPMMTLTYLTQRSIWASVRLNGKNVTKLVKKQNLQQMSKLKEVMFLKRFRTQGAVCLQSSGCIHVHDYHFQTSSLELLGQSKSNLMWWPLVKREQKLK